MDVAIEGTRLVLRGDFDVRSTGEVRRALYALLAEESDVVVDLTGVTTVDLTALRVLAAATRQAGRDGHRIRLSGCGPAVTRLLHMSRLIRVVEVDRMTVTV